MRHIRTRRRLRSLLTALLAASSILLFENRAESFVPQLKNIVEARIEAAFGGKFLLSIGGMDGGILRPFILNDVKITDMGGVPVLSSISVKSIRSDYRVWDIALKKLSDLFFAKGRVSPFEGYFSAKPRIYVNFASKDREVAGYLRFEGDIEDADISGHLVMFGEDKISLAGKLKAGAYEISLAPKAGYAVRLSGFLAGSEFVTANIKIDHVKIRNFDIVCEAVVKTKVTKARSADAESDLDGELEIKNFILNYRPFYDFKAQYKVRGGILEISGLDVGSDFKLRGRISLIEPYNVNVTCLADNANLNKVLAFAGVEKDAVISGILNGKFDIKGPLKKIRSETKIDIRRGVIGGLDFERLTALFKGEGPMIRIEDSRVTRESGHFVLAGEMDLRKIGKDALFQDIKLLSSDTAIDWDAWDTEKSNGAKAIKMEKKMSDEVSLGFKKFVQDQKIDESVRDRDEVEFEYRIHPNDSLKMMLGNDNDFVGLQHKDKF